MPKPIVVRVGHVELHKVNADQHEWRDAYQWLLSLKWPQFVGLVLGVYMAVNVLFAALYALGGDCIAGMTPGSFPEAFFFSVQTLATVGYGHMYPQSVYGHVLTIIELVSGMFWLAVMTGLIFVRFSRPTARVLFSNSIVIGEFDGRPALMLRVANLRHQSMVEVEFRIMFMRDQAILEDETYRHFYSLKLEADRLVVFPAALTLRHLIDENSPLYGATAESLEASRATFVASLIGIETVMSAAVQSQKDYSWRDVRFGERFVDVYTERADGGLFVDYARLHETMPIQSASIVMVENR